MAFGDRWGSQASIIANRYARDCEPLRLFALRGIPLNFAEHQSRILASEGDAVRDGVLEIELARLARNVIEVTLRIRLVYVDRRRYDAVPHRMERSSDSRRAARPLRVADQALQR